MEDTSQPWYKKLWVISIMVFLGFLVIGSVIGGDNANSQPDVLIVPNKKENTEISGEMKEAPKPSAILPGISAVDVYGNLEDIGFSCVGPIVGSDGLVYWECKEETSEHMYFVEILGESSSKILTVQATALNYGNASTVVVAQDFFGYVASVPYENSDQVFARSWVKDNISQKTNTIIHGVRFSLAGNERSKILTVAHEHSDLD